MFLFLFSFSLSLLHFLFFLFVFQSCFFHSTALYWSEWMNQLTFYQIHNLHPHRFNYIGYSYRLSGSVFLLFFFFFLFNILILFFFLSLDCLSVRLVVKRKKKKKKLFLLFGCCCLSCYFDFHFFKHCHIHFNPHHL